MKNFNQILKSKSKFALVLVSMLASGSVFAAEQTLECNNAEGFKVKFAYDDATNLGDLTYGLGQDTTTIEGLATSFFGGVGAAVKSTQVLFVVTPAFPKKLGELVIEGKTYLVECK